MFARTALSLLVLASFGASAQSATPARPAAPHFELPFNCAYALNGTTDADAVPSRGIAFERGSEVPTAALASAGGIVREVRDNGTGNAGRYVVIDHGRGWTTTYTHLSQIDVRKHDRVEAGQRLGKIGYIGRSLRTYLHYMQSHGGKAVAATFNSTPAKYYGQQTYTSRNGCGAPEPIFGHTGNGDPTQVGVVMVRSGVTDSAGYLGELFIPNQVKVHCQLVGSNTWRGGSAIPYGADLWYRIDYDGTTGYVPALEVTLPRNQAAAMCPTFTTLDVGKSATMIPGQQIQLPEGASLTYLRVASDSRCRPDVQCVWAGEAKLDFLHTSATGQTRPLTVTITGTGEADAQIAGGWTVKLSNLSFDNAPKLTIQLVKSAPVVQKAALSPGQQIQLPAAESLTYVGVVSDSRCRPGVYCYWAGEAKLQFQFSSPTVRTQPVTITVPGPAVEVGPFKVKVTHLSFDAAPRASIEFVRN